MQKANVLTRDLYLSIKAMNYEKSYTPVSPLKQADMLGK